METKLIPQSHSLIITDVLIRQDSDGRYCLNDLHHAAGGEECHAPNRFTRTDSFKKLVEVLTPEMASAPVIVISTGFPGTYVVKELVYAYAMWISAAFHLKVIRAYDALVSGSYSSPPLQHFSVPVEANRVFESFHSLALKIGFEGNQAVLSANMATRQLTGVDPLQLMGATHLLAGNQNRHFTPTELGTRYDMTAREFNIALEAAGLQTKHGKQWMPTVKGRAYAVLLDTQKRKGTGTPIQQLKWTADIVDVLPALKGGAA